jgi:hypothetical protein
MVRACSEATKAATLPTSPNTAVRFSRAACSIPAVIVSRTSAGTVSSIDSSTPPVFRVTTRMPCGLSSHAHWRRRPPRGSAHLRYGMICQVVYCSASKKKKTGRAGKRTFPSLYSSKLSSSSFLSLGRIQRIKVRLIFDDRKGKVQELSRRSATSDLHGFASGP